MNGGREEERTQEGWGCSVSQAAPFFFFLLLLPGGYTLPFIHISVLTLALGSLTATDLDGFDLFWLEKHPHVVTQDDTRRTNAHALFTSPHTHMCSNFKTLDTPDMHLCKCTQFDLCRLFFTSRSSSFPAQCGPLLHLVVGNCNILSLCCDELHFSVAHG